MDKNKLTGCFWRFCSKWT